MSESPTSCHGHPHSHSYVVDLLSVGGEDRPEVGELEDVLKSVISAEDGGSKRLLVLDFPFPHCLVHEPTAETLVLTYRLVLVSMCLSGVDPHPTFGFTREVTDLTPERSVLDV